MELITKVMRTNCVSPPLESTGYIFNKVKFRDTLCVRYNWPLPNIPRFCACGEKTGVDHSCVCKLGGLIHMRHDNVRDVEAEFLDGHL